MLAKLIFLISTGIIAVEKKKSLLLDLKEETKKGNLLKAITALQCINVSVGDHYMT